MWGLCLALTVYPGQASASWPRWWGCGRVLVATWPGPPGVEGRWPQPGGVWGWVRGGGTGSWCGGRVADHGGNLTSPNGPQPAQPPAWTPARTTQFFRRHFFYQTGDVITEPNWNATPGHWNIHEQEGDFAGGERGVNWTHQPTTSARTTNCSPQLGCISDWKYRASISRLNIIASVWREERRGEERLVLRLARWDDVIGGLEVTGVTYPGVPPPTSHRTLNHTEPHSPLASRQPPSSAKHEEKKSCGWKMQTEWALNHKRLKAWQKRWNMTAKPWISRIQSRTSSISATQRLLRLEAREDSNDTLFMVAEYLFGIQMGH